LPSLKDIKDRIKSVKEVQQITKAMKMVAAAKLRKSEANLQHLRLFIEKLETMVFRALSHHPAVPINVFGRLEVNRSGLIVLSGDKGLCGGFNSGVVRQTLKHMKDVDRERVRLFGFGKKVNAL
jgi:F-type H+-transporting ATPase subunit gamma